MYEFEVMKERYIHNLTRDEAIIKLTNKGTIITEIDPTEIDERVQQRHKSGTHVMSPKGSPQKIGSKEIRSGESENKELDKK